MRFAFDLLYLWQCGFWSFMIKNRFLPEIIVTFWYFWPTVSSWRWGWGSGDLGLGRSHGSWSFFSPDRIIAFPSSIYHPFTRWIQIINRVKDWVRLKFPNIVEYFHAEIPWLFWPPHKNQSVRQGWVSKFLGPWLQPLGLNFSKDLKPKMGLKIFQ